MSPPRVLIEWPGEWNKQFFPEKGPVRTDDVEFMGIKTGKILDFSPIGSGQQDVLRFVNFSQEVPFCLMKRAAARGPYLPMRLL
jgi:hypothetical protein